MPSRQIFNARTQRCEDADLSIGRNSEVIATFADGTFVKFPARLNSDQFTALIERHQQANDRHHPS
jgi:hypothetical protein